ncbi:alpha/beta fold hydrolase [Agromyces ramosus]|nr:alpha/beta hydrolase [Agromyces ramosus]
MEPRFGLAVSLAVATALVSGGCTTGGDQASPAGARGDSAASDAADEIARSSERIDIGGRALHLQCWGEQVAGEPTVLLVTGQGPTTSSWELMASEFATDGHHLCAYDRAGVGGSDPAPEASRTTKDQVTDLVALLDAADLQEPVILTAHSLGSLPAVGLVARAPERVAGVVLIDPWSPRVSVAQRAALPPEKPDESPEVAEERRFLTDFLFDPAQNPEHLLVAASDEEVAGLLDNEPGPIFGELPVVVLRAPPLPYLPGLPRDYHEATLAAITAGHQEFAGESTRGALIQVEDTGHNIQDDRPEVVMDAIRDVMAGDTG